MSADGPQLWRVPFGVATDGEPVELYLLRSASGIEASVATWGATLVSLRVPDRRGELADVVLGFDELAGYLQPQPYLGATIGRHANRIANGRLSIGKAQVQLDRNEGEHHLHGGLRGFDRQHWRARVEEPAGASVAFERTSEDGEAGYPGRLAVRVRYTLVDEAGLRIDYWARTDAPTVLNLTNHSYFNLAGEGTVLSHRLRVAGDRCAIVDGAMIPTGELREVAGTPMDLRSPAVIGEHLAMHDEQLSLGQGFDHAWWVGGRGELREIAELHDPRSGRTMTVHATQPALQVYTGNRLDGSIVGRHGRPLVRHAGVCLETQHLPDSPNHPAFSSTRLDPGQTYRQTTIYRFGAA